MMIVAPTMVLAEIAKITPKAPDELNAVMMRGLSLFMWAAMGLSVAGIIGTGIWFLLSHRAGNGESVQSKALTIVGGCSLVAGATSLVNFLIL